ncbi:MAG: triacylglycerol lipase [Clostridiales bacterium]|nr:triacylglycerol lipase [Clostridiales bacterium]
MKGTGRIVLTAAGLLLLINAPLLMMELFPWPVGLLLALTGTVAFCLPIRRPMETVRLRAVRRGALLTVLSWAAFVLQLAWLLPYGLLGGGETLSLIVNGVWSAAVLLLVMTDGMFRLVFLSAQAGIVRRILLFLFWWMPVLNLVLAAQLCHAARLEYSRELARIERDAVRQENERCHTRYPLLLVHGVFFRDWQYFNYWGRIPKELQRNGAQVYYGGQQSAAPVAVSGAELCAQVKELVERTGCGKVNIIAHSKGGLDARYAVSCLGIAPLVASITTVNTPHRGCVWAEKLLAAAPKPLAAWLARRYNALFSRLGDDSPDFLGAVNSLTASACAQLNEQAPDQEGVFYQSVTSRMRRPSGDGFPLNVSYRLVRHFEGDNDGLVSPASAVWGNDLGVLEPKGRRGISHGDMIDLHRAELPDFDVREFYVDLASGLKERGL